MSSILPRRNNSTSLKKISENAVTDVSESRKKVENNQISSNLMNIPDSKWIQVFINGDEYFQGCRCVINSRYYRNLDMLLNYLTERLKPSFGAIRNIYTPVNGHPVSSLEDLISKQKYVVAGNERFKKLDFGYIEGTDKKLKRYGRKPKNKFKVPKARPICQNILNIYCHQNGHFKIKPSKIILHSQDLENWEHVFQKINEVLKCGPIKRVYTLNGKPLQALEELVNNQTYVIVGKHEVFKPGPYEILLLQNSTSSKEKYYSQHSSRKSSSVVTSRSASVHSHTSAQAKRLHFTLSFDESNREIPPEAPVSNSLTVIGLGSGNDSFDSNRPSIRESETKETLKIKINLDNDVSGIFRSKVQNDLTAGAVEVEDSPETLIDLPVDLLDAEEVDDEITPDMERSLQNLNLDVPEEIVAYLPSMQSDRKSTQNTEDAQVSNNKYNMNHSQTLDIHNIYA